MKILKKEQGSIVLEAAIIMPFLLAFVISMICFVQIAITDMALQSSVSETTKQVSAHLYPIYLLSQTSTGETLTEDFSALIPEVFLNIVEHPYNSIVHKALLPILKLYADDKLLNLEQLNVVHATLPQLNHKQESFFSITGSYSLKLFIPFVDKEIELRKKAYERIWIGG